ncbi:DUF3021 domain-containing protein [Bacillus solimangrovi]|uniref:DUF3021 domain-containing protein n=1 Tax=Bacillus solimangrovi TaxID=1305675 RepID=A0A1E5LID0_9BACI|nr:DUF3021 domain-containing protein [Bacillus solimangrovi]OEH93844.1 hypothetical protein BFG57_11020 [Bacillus solimangrovi]
MRNIIQHALLGALIGLSASYIIITIVLLNNPTRTLNGQELLLECLLAVSLGIGCGLASLVFQNDRMSFLSKLAIHYVVILTLVLICGAVGNWYDNPVEEPVGFLMFILIQFIIYLIIYVAIYWANLRDVKEINKQLK